MGSTDTTGARPNPPENLSALGHEGARDPKQRNSTPHVAGKYRTEPVFGAVAFQMAGKHVPGSSWNAPGTHPWDPPLGHRNPPPI